MSAPLFPDGSPLARLGEQQTPQQKLHLLLAGIWERSKKTIAERVQILREAELAAIEHTLDETARLRAVDAAHKLAGVLGTFGLPRGTELAREAEGLLEKSTPLSCADLNQFRTLLDQLDTLVKTAPLPSSEPDPEVTAEPA